MFGITLKNLLARKLRLFTTGIAVLIGVAFMSGTMVLTDTITATFNDLFADVNAGVDVQVRREATVEADGMEVRGRLSEDVVPLVARVDGVEAAAGVVQGFTQIAGSDGEPLGRPGQGPPTYGMTWIADADLNPFHVVEGRAPAADDEVVIDRGSATKGKLAVGDTINLDAAEPVPPLKLVGITAFGAADSPGGASFVGFTPAAAQEYVGKPGQIDLILVKARDGISEGTLRSRIAAALPDGLEARTGTEITKESQKSIAGLISFFSTFMLAFALVALFVGSFIIYNTFSILVAQRTREVALLRAVGASRRQVMTSIVAESVVVGGIASVTGIVAGIGVAGLLKALLAGVGMDIPAGGIALTPRTVVVCLVVGTLVTVASALLPARRAARVAPIAALSEAAVETEDNLGRRIAIGAVVTALGSALGAYALFLGPSNPAAIVGVGGVVMFIGLGILGPAIARPVASALGAPLPVLRGVSGRLARENAMRNPRRTSGTASALMIGVALVAFITIFAASAKAAINDIMAEQFAGDFVVQSGSFGFGGLEPSVLKAVAALPEVEAATGVRPSPLAFDGKGAFAGAVDPVALAKIVEVDVEKGDFAAIGLDGIGIDKDVAAKKGLHVGDTVPVAFASTGEKTLTVRAIYDAGAILPDYLLSVATQDANYDEHFDSEIYVKTADGVSTADARRAIESATSGAANAEVLDRAGYVDAQAQDINQMLGLIYALLGLAVLIAVIGIANTLALSIHERTRELGVLRAVGMTRSQLRTSVRWESVIIALLGTALGLAVGILFGWAMVMSVADEGFSALVIPGGQLAVIALLAAGCGVIAAIRPARRAARLDVLAAIATA